MKNVENFIQELENEVSELGEIKAYPYIRDLMDWLTKRFSSIYAELQHIEADLYTQFAERVFPEAEGRALPAHTIAQYQPKSNREELTTDWTGYVDKTSIYFSPIVPTTLYNVSIRYQLHPTMLKIFDSDVPQVMPLRATLSNPKKVYIGLEMPLDLNELERLSLMFDNVRAELRKLLPFVQYRCAEGSPIRVQIKTECSNDVKTPFPSAEYLTLKRLKNMIRQHYEDKFSFLTIKNMDTRQCFSDVSNALPETIQERVKDETILWIELLFPDGFSEIDLEKLQIKTNCVPVWNVKVCREGNTYRNGEVMIPLLNEDKATIVNQFLAFEQVRSDVGELEPSQVHGSKYPSYTLHYGYFEHFKTTQIRFRIESLLHLMEGYNLLDFTKVVVEQSPHIHIEGCDTIIPQLRQLNEAFLDIQKQIAFLPKLPPQYYLRFQTIEADKMLYFKYLLTQGQWAMQAQLPAALKLVSKETDMQETGRIVLKSAHLLSKPVGGRAALSLVQKEELIREHLSTVFNHHKNFTYG